MSWRPLKYSTQVGIQALYKGKTYTLAYFGVALVVQNLTTLLPISFIKKIFANANFEQFWKEAIK